MAISWMNLMLLHIAGAHITEIILDDEPIPERDESIYFISSKSNKFAARGTNNGNGLVTAMPLTTAVNNNKISSNNNNNNLQNPPFGIAAQTSQQSCTIEIPVVKKYAGHCIRLGKKGKGCVAGEHIIPYHLDCL